MSDELSESNEEDSGDEARVRKANTELRHLEAIKRRLGLTEQDFQEFRKSQEKHCDKEKAVITAAGKPRKEPEIIVFEDPTKKARACHVQFVHKKSTNSLFQFSA